MQDQDFFNLYLNDPVFKKLNEFAVCNFRGRELHWGYILHEILSIYLHIYYIYKVKKTIKFIFFMFCAQIYFYI